MNQEYTDLFVDLAYLKLINPFGLCTCHCNSKINHEAIRSISLSKYRSFHMYANSSVDISYYPVFTSSYTSFLRCFSTASGICHNLIIIKLLTPTPTLGPYSDGQYKSVNLYYFQSKRSSLQENGFLL